MDPTIRPNVIHLGAWRRSALASCFCIFSYLLYFYNFFYICYLCKVMFCVCLYVCVFVAFVKKVILTYQRRTFEQERCY